jgi:uncharacterized membrane protein
MAETQVEKAKDAAEDVTDKVTPDGDGNGGGGGDIAKKILLPAAAGLGTLAATYAARKAPDLLREKLQPKLEEKGADEAKKVGQKAAEQVEDSGGPMGTLVGKALGKATGGGGGGDSQGKTRRLPIQRWTDIAAPVATVYEKWTQFEEFPKFMHRVLSVEQKDGQRVSWEEKIWFSKRQWEGEITDRRKNDRIAWKTVSGTAHAGVVSFHKLDDNLTRVMVTMDFRPSGMIEKMASGLRFAKRAVQSDLARFKAYVEMDSAKGLEYSHEATTKDEDEEGDEQEAKSRTSGKRKNGKEQKEQNAKNESETDAKAQSNGSGSDDESSEDQEQAREERAQRREERRS